MYTNRPTFARAKVWACRLSTPVFVALLASGCTQQPIGPTITALPGHGMSQQDFQSADITCRDKAQARTDIPRETPANLYNMQPPVISQQQLYNVVYGQCMAARGSLINSEMVAVVPFYPYAYPGYSSYPGMAQ